MKTNIVLIGMPGVGKSTLGVLLAKTMTKRFVDTDLLIQERARSSLQSVLNNQGYLALRAMEEQVLLDLNERNAVIATGGSAVHSRAGMKALCDSGCVLFMNASLGTLEARIDNLQTRGIAAAPNMGLSDIYQERLPLYQQYAELTLEVDKLSVSEAHDAAIGMLGTYGALEAH